MKTAINSLALCMIAGAGFLAGCDRRVPNKPPQPDTEVQSVIDVVWATHVVTDIDMMCAYAGVNERYHMPYAQVESQDSSINMMDAVRDTHEDRISVVFNRTKCRDGRFRDGEVRLIYNTHNGLNPYANPNSHSYHQFGFGGLLNLNNYRIDSFLVTIPHPGHGFIINRLPESNDRIDLQTTPLKWEILSKFHFQHPTDESGKQDIYLDVALIKVLENSPDPAVYDPGRQIAIDWNRAVVGYYGTITGKRGDDSFTVEIKESQRLIRDFTCVPDRARGVALDERQGLTRLDGWHHPFVNGIATFKPSQKYPRQVYFGNESNVNLAWQCDNAGEVFIKGIAYRVNFRK